MTLLLLFGACRTIAIPPAQDGTFVPVAPPPDTAVDTGLDGPASLIVRNALGHRSRSYLGFDPKRTADDGKVEVLVDGKSAGVVHFSEQLAAGSSGGTHTVQVLDATTGAPLAEGQVALVPGAANQVTLCPPLLSVWNRGRLAFDLTVDHTVDKTDTHSLTLPASELPFGIDVAEGTIRARTFVGGELKADHQGTVELEQSLLCSTREAIVDFALSTSTTDPTVCSVINRDEDCHGELGLHRSRLLVP